MKQPRNVSLRLTPEQKTELKTLANNSGMTFSAYLEAILRDAIDERPKYQATRVSKEQPQTAPKIAQMH